MTLRDPGFTLIELTLVTVIILALAGLSIPLFKKTFSDLSAKNAAFNISKLSSYAQEKAILDRKNYKAIFDFNKRSYQILEGIPTADALVYRKIKGRFGNAFTLPQGLHFYDLKAGAVKETSEEYKKAVVFYPDGHCDELLIAVVDNSKKGYSVSIKGFGSLAQIKEVASDPYSE